MSKRLPVERVESVIWGNLAAHQRDDLTDRLHDLWSEYFVGMTKADFLRTHLLDHTHLVMSFGQGDELAGFANINPHVLTHDERKYLVLTSGLLHEIARIRRLNVDATNPWITHFPVRVADAARIEQTRSYQRGSPNMSWYLEQAPNWTNGHVVPLWVPIDMKNAAGVLWNLLRNAVQPQR